ncbi:DUF6722 family protein [Parabacteroides sp.]
MKKKQVKALYGEVAKFSIDIAKYIITAVLISTILNEVSPFDWLAYTVCILLTVIAFCIGLYYTKKKEE